MGVLSGVVHMTKNRGPCNNKLTFIAYIRTAVNIGYLSNCYSDNTRIHVTVQSSVIITLTKDRPTSLNPLECKEGGATAGPGPSSL